MIPVYNQINGRFLRVNPESKAKIAAVTSFDAVMEVIDKTEEDFVSKGFTIVIDLLLD